MSDQLTLRLGWLPPPPPDFAARCKALPNHDAPGREAQALARHALDANQLARLARALARAAGEGRGLAPLAPFRLGLLGNGTLDLLAPALIATAARHGLALEIVQADYGQTTQEALIPTSRINAARPDAVLLAIDHRGLPMRLQAGDAADERRDIEGSLAALAEIRDAIRAHSGAPAIVQTLAPPPEGLFGALDRIVPGTPRRVIDSFNRALADGIADSPDLLLDVATLAETVGLETWHCPAQWNLAKLAFAEACLPIYADHVARLIAAMRGRSRRCLILDLDNTLWGGVIGDDGIEGIRIAQGDATGEAHLAVQELALALRRRGIVLAVSSKNDDAVARTPFRDHPEMLLKEEHFAVFQANWNDKASNIRAIADELALGLDAMVFLDDNPVERDQVRQALPEVAVPELPDDPAWYARTLAAAGYFEAVAFSEEDRGRAGMYQANAARAALREGAGAIDDYLASLEMEIMFAPFDRTGRARIAQLIAKSNQFNLTTRRYTEPEIDALADDPTVFTLQVRLVDRFANNGMISTVICRPAGDRTWTIDSWLMSCRVLGRGVERMVLREILRHARAAGIERIVGTYLPTPRNGLVRDHYATLGFALREERADGATVWELAADAAIAPAAIAVCRAGFAEPIPA